MTLKDLGTKVSNGSIGEKCVPPLPLAGMLIAINHK